MPSSESTCHNPTTSVLTSFAGPTHAPTTLYWLGSNTPQTVQAIETLTASATKEYASRISPILVANTSSDSVEEKVVAWLYQWQGDGICLLSSNLLTLIPPDVIAKHPFQNRLAWVDSLSTLSLVPKLLGTTVPRYIHVGDPLAWLWLSDWLERLETPDTATPLFPATLHTPCEYTWAIDGSKSLETTVQAVLSQCHQWQTQAVSELHTCLIEALTNAMYHAPVDAQGRKKYLKHQTLDNLPACDQIHVGLRRHQGWVILTITDHYGGLTAPRLLQGLFRQSTDDGLLDVDGRGMLLMHVLPQGWANYRTARQQLTTVFVHPTEAHPHPENADTRSFWFVERT